MREGAVVADVAAELGQRDEHLARIGDEPPWPRSRNAAATRISAAVSVQFAEGQSLAVIEAAAARGFVENRGMFTPLPLRAADKRLRCRQETSRLRGQSRHDGGFLRLGRRPNRRSRGRQVLREP